MNTWGKLGTFGANIIMNLQDFRGQQIVSLLFKVLTEEGQEDTAAQTLECRSSLLLTQICDSEFRDHSPWLMETRLSLSSVLKGVLREYNTSLSRGKW